MCLFMLQTFIHGTSRIHDTLHDDPDQDIQNTKCQQSDVQNYKHDQPRLLLKHGPRNLRELGQQHETEQGKHRPRDCSEEFIWIKLGKHLKIIDILRIPRVGIGISPDHCDNKHGTTVQTNQDQYRCPCHCFKSIQNSLDYHPKLAKLPRQLQQTQESQSPKQPQCRQIAQGTRIARSSNENHHIRQRKHDYDDIHYVPDVGYICPSTMCMNFYHHLNNEDTQACHFNDLPDSLPRFPCNVQLQPHDHCIDTDSCSDNTMKVNTAHNSLRPATPGWTEWLLCQLTLLQRQPQVAKMQGIQSGFPRPQILRPQRSTPRVCKPCLLASRGMCMAKTRMLIAPIMILVRQLTLLMGIRTPVIRVVCSGHCARHHKTSQDRQTNSKQT
mmetsp:Transcript_25450/g.61555  ORF Transcript_25450/g.61555 Transcript_25450/m.61555 type:complete len:384 (+) Transcript_25450:987-2138(+)